jgi:MerR family redox-sensitive transcriptional activator SoxR
MSAWRASASETSSPVTPRRWSFRWGLSLEEITDVLASLPRARTPTAAERRRLSQSWRPRLDARIVELERLRDRLDSCIGCGCLSLQVCRLSSPDDVAASLGSGPRWLLGED